MGGFLHAETAGLLEPQLQRILSDSQSTSITGAKLSVHPMLDSLRIKRACRQEPDFVPLDVGQNDLVLLGNLSGAEPTDVLLEVEVPPQRGGVRGPVPALQIRLDSDGEVLCGGEESINFTTSYKEASSINEEVERMRHEWGS